MSKFTDMKQALEVRIREIGDVEIMDHKRRKETGQPPTQEGRDHYHLGRGCFWCGSDLEIEAEPAEVAGREVAVMRCARPCGLVLFFDVEAMPDY